jgi:hypothetical protein
MGLICVPISLFVQFFQISMNVTYFLFSLIEPVGPVPNLSDSIGSIFGCNIT